MNHVKELDRFLEIVSFSIYYEIKEAEGTHYTRLYLRLIGSDNSGVQYLYAILVLINFTNDRPGRNSNFEAAKNMAIKMKEELEQKGIQIEIKSS